MAAKQKVDVHTKIGLRFIAFCGCVGFFVGGFVLSLGDRAGLIHIAQAHGALHAVTNADVVLFGILGAGDGLINGVLLAIGKRFWIGGLVIGLLPMGVFGCRTAELTPKPYSGSANAVAFWLIPILITVLCALLRREVWRRHAKPVIGPSTRSS